MLTLKNNFFKCLPFILLLCASVFLTLWQNSAKVVIDGVSLWAFCVLPSVFPYLFISAMAQKTKGAYLFGKLSSPLTKKLFNVGDMGGYLFIVSTLSGYPSGAKAVADAKMMGMLSDVESQRASAFCSIASPVFLISAVGSVTFNNRLFGILLFLSNFLASIIVGIVFSFYKRKDNSVTQLKTNQIKNEILLFDLALNAVTSILVIGALITFFYLLTEMLIALKILTPLTKFLYIITGDKHLSEGIAAGIIEVTCGLKKLSATNSKFALSVASFLTGFGGLSIIMQSTAFLKKAKIKTAPFILSKILSAVFSFFISLIFSVIFL